MSSAPVIFWFRQDLRLEDLPGLAAAAALGPVYPLYILDEINPGDWVPGGASRWWLHHGLAALAGEIEERGGNLVLRRGDPAVVLPEVAADIGAAAVYCSRCFEPWAAELEQRLHRDLSGSGVDFRCFPGSLLFEPAEIQTSTGGPFRVFTPFWKYCLANATVPPAENLPKNTGFLRPDPGGEALEALDLLPVSPDWVARLPEPWPQLWQPGSAGARARLRKFLASGIEDYAEGRDWPARPNTSRLSPHLHFGELSPRELWRRLMAFREQQPELEHHVDKFLSELGWREFSRHLLHHYPSIPDQPFNADYGKFPWQGNDQLLHAWQQGRTGYPIVDAGMRELWSTGYMHNRVRMIAASFLTKHLLIPWQVGERWFWDTLVDADLANNACGWQWVAGSGADAAPYFRIFNPALQGRKFDPEGEYVRRWVPEIAALPDRHLHDPSAASPKVLEQANITLGEDYPAPIVDHRQAREAALAAWNSMRAG